MKLYIIFMLVALVILITRRETFVEVFGLSGYNKPVDYVRFNDPRPNLSGYSEVEANVTHDEMEAFALTANDEISRRLGTPTYIIETAKIKKYSGRDNNIFDCVFMVMKKGGFSYGFSVVASFEVKGKTTKLVSLRTQPLGSRQPSNVKAFTEGAPGKEFVKYELVKEAAVPTKSEFEKAKNNLK